MLPRGIPMPNEKSKTEFITAMEGFRRGIFKEPFKVSADRPINIGTMVYTKRRWK